MEEWKKKKLKIWAVFDIIPFYTVVGAAFLLDIYAPFFAVPSLIIGLALWGLLLLVSYKIKGKKYFEM